MITEKYFSALSELGIIYGEIATVITITVLLIAGTYTIGKLISRILRKR